LKGRGMKNNEMKIISIFVDMKKKKPTKKASKKREFPKWYITKDHGLVSSLEGKPGNILTEITLNNYFYTKLDAKTVRDILTRKPRKKK
jgi:hypothetical protein